MKALIRSKITLVLLLASCGLARPLRADVSTFQDGANGYAGTRDSSISSGSPNTNAATATTVLAVLIPGSLQPPVTIEGLLKFGALIGNGSNQIPPGATINSVSLQLRTKTQAGGSTNQVRLHRVIIPWSEISTWNTLNNGVSLDNIDARSVADVVFIPPAPVPFSVTLKNAALAATVQAWVDGTAPNQGWVIVNPGADDYSFSSSEDAVIADRPLLSVSFTPPPPVPPGITSQPQDQVVCLGSSALFAVGASGTPPPGYQWFLNNQAISNATSSQYFIPSVSSTDVGTYFVQVSNSAGTTNSTNAVLSLLNQPPQFFSCPTGIVINADPGVCSKTNVTWFVGVTDVCDPKVFAVCNPSSGSTFHQGTSTVVCTATDSSGLSSSCTFQVIVISDQPALSCPGDITVIDLQLPAGVPVSFNVTATSSCAPNVTVFCQPPSGSIFPLGATPVLCTATDSASNQNSCGFRVLVVPPSCCDNKVWTQPNVAGPQARYGHAMAYDSRRGRVVLFGGSGSQGVLGDTWEWDGFAWGLRANNGPSPRADMAMAYDSARGRVVLFGGVNFSGPAPVEFADTWEWDGTAWRSNSIAGPPARQNHAMAYDSARRVTVMFGGLSATGAEFTDTWEYTGAKWVAAPAGIISPGPRQGHVMAYGSVQNQMLLFGGSRSGGLLGDTWQWDGTSWTRLATKGPARQFAAMAYNDNCDSIVLFGGYIPSIFQALGDTWEWNGSAWALSNTNGPGPRSLHAMAHDSAHDMTVLFGGSPPLEGLYGDTWEYSLNPTPPQVRSFYSVCGDNKLLIAFSAPVSAATAEDPSHYLILCNTTKLDIIQAVLAGNSQLVCLTTAQPLDNSCNLFINGVEDLCGHALRFQSELSCRTEACPRQSQGTEFWLTFPGNYAPDPTNAPRPKLFITGFGGTIGSVTMPGLGLPPIPFAIPASGEVTVTLPRKADLGDASDLIQTNGVHVIASQPVSVYGMSHVPLTSDAYLGLPIKALGKTYLVAAYPNVFSDVPELNGVQFAIVAPEDGTTVLIDPSVAVGGHPAHVPFTISLMKGQTYQLRNTNPAPADLTGTIIAADHPVAAFGSHACANIPDDNTFFCNYLVEQLFPTELWGNSFVTVPLKTRLNGDTFRFMALLGNTTVTVNGVPFGPINQGKFFDLQLTSASQILSSRPILVAQYSDSSDFDMVTNSDPFMVLIPPTAMFANNYNVETPVTDFSDNYINIMVPTSAAGSVFLDGAALPAASFSAIGASGFSGAQVQVGTGPHNLTTGTGDKFGVVVYGWNLYDAYGYPGGICGSPGRGTTFICPQTNFVLTAGAGCVAQVPDLSQGLLGIGNGAGGLVLAVQDPPAGANLPPGNYPVMLTLFDTVGSRQTCSNFLVIQPSTTPTPLCPSNIVTVCTSKAGALVNYLAGQCNPNGTVTCNPPSGTLFQPGTTKVSCVTQGAAGTVNSCSFTVSVICLTLTTSFSNNNVVVTWQPGATLQRATNVTGPWITLPVTNGPLTFPVTGKQGFFRLLQQSPP